MTTFAQLSARLKNFLGGWLLVLGIKEGLVECATVCIKIVVILIDMAQFHYFGKQLQSKVAYDDSRFYQIEWPLTLACAWSSLWSYEVNIKCTHKKIAYFWKNLTIDYWLFVCKNKKQESVFEWAKFWQEFRFRLLLWQNSSRKSWNILNASRIPKPSGFSSQNSYKNS